MRGRFNAAAAARESIKCEKSLLVPGLLLAAGGGGNATATASTQKHTFGHKGWKSANNGNARPHI